MATLRELADVYVDRLILQYRTKTKARDTIAISVKQALADDVASTMLTCFDVDTAAGSQLDVIGKYVGIPRNIGIAVAQGYFGLWAYASTLAPANFQAQWDPTTNVPELPDPTTATGDWWVVGAPGTSTAPINEDWLAGDIIYSDGVDWHKQTLDNGNGLTTYGDATSNAAGVFYSYATAARQASDLTDVSYRTVLKLRIILNSNDGTLGTIVALLLEFFPDLITVTDTKDMNLAYRVVSTVPLSKELLTAYLPKPMGVGISVTIVNPVPPSGGDHIQTEDGFNITTEDGQSLVTEPTT